MTGFRGRWCARRDYWKSSPKSLKDAGRRSNLIRARQWGVIVALAALLAAMPFVVWLSVTIGARGRASNCQVVLHTLLAHDHAIVGAFLKASEDPRLSEEQLRDNARKADAATKDLDRRTIRIMEGCHG